MEEHREIRRIYREDVEAFLKRRHIKKTLPTLIWLRGQKVQSVTVKTEAAEEARIEVEVLDDMISEIEREGK